MVKWMVLIVKFRFVYFFAVSHILLVKRLLDLVNFKHINGGFTFTSLTPVIRSPRDVFSRALKPSNGQNTPAFVSL